MELVPLHVGVALGHFLHAFVPVRHGDGDAVRFGRRGEVLLRRRAGELEGEFQDAVDADAAHHRFLHHDLALGAGEHLAADRRILTLGVLAHHPEVDVAGLAVGERARHARHQPHRPQIDVLIEFAAEQDQRAPQRDVVGHAVRHADGAEIDGVVLADLVFPILRHHAAVLFVIVATGEIEIVEPQLEAEFLRRGFEDAHALGHDLLANAVAGNDRDAVNAIGLHKQTLVRTRSPSLSTLGRPCASPRRSRAGR